MTALINRIKTNLNADADVAPALAMRLDKLAEDMKAPVAQKRTMFH